MTTAGDGSVLTSAEQLWSQLGETPIAETDAAAQQLAYLVLLQRAERYARRDARRARQSGTRVSSPYDGEAADLAWSRLALLPASEMFEQFSKALRHLATFRGTDVAPRSMPEMPLLLIEPPELLARVVARIDSIDLPSRPTFDQGRFMDHVTSLIQFPKKQAKETGKFRTPRHIASLLISMLDPQPGDRVLDPCCGTGGFLVGALHYVLRRHTDLAETGDALGEQLSPRQRAQLEESLIRGADSDRTMAFLTSATLLLAGIRDPAVDRADSLEAGVWRETASVVLMNPPFKTTSRSGPDVLFLRTGPAVLLFLLLAEAALIPGGRAAVVVPDGVLFNTGEQYRKVRERLLAQSTVEAVVSLPSGVFRPASGSKASVIIFRKGGSTSSVWMYDVTADGFTLNDRRTPIDDSDLPDVLLKWGDRQPGDKSFSVPIGTLEAAGWDLSVGRHKPVRLELPAPGDPRVIANEITGYAEDVTTGAAELQRIIGNA